MISGHSHSFDVGIAKTLGINCAIVFNHIVYWLRVNAHKSSNIRDGKIWMYETQQDIAECLDYLTVDEVKKAIIKLLRAGILIKGNYNKNPFDRTNWYTTADQNIIQKKFTKEQIGTNRDANLHDSKCESEPCIYKQKEQHKDKKQEQTADADLSVSVCSLNKELSSVLTEEKSQEKKDQAFNWFVKIGCDPITALALTEKYTIADIEKASIYVSKQLEINRKKNVQIKNIVAYLRKTLEGKYWETKQ